MPTIGSVSTEPVLEDGADRPESADAVKSALELPDAWPLEASSTELVGESLLSDRDGTEFGVALFLPLIALPVGVPPAAPVEAADD